MLHLLHLAGKFGSNIANGGRSQDLVAIAITVNLGRERDTEMCGLWRRVPARVTLQMCKGPLNGVRG